MSPGLVSFCALIRSALIFIIKGKQGKESMDNQGYNCPFQFFRKRDGLLVPFREEKIANAIFKAGEAASRQSGSIFTRETAERIAHEVVKQLDNPNCEYYTLPDADGNRIPKLEDVQDMVEITLGEKKMAGPGAA